MHPTELYPEAIQHLAKDLHIVHTKQDELERQANDLCNALAAKVREIHNIRPGAIWTRKGTTNTVKVHRIQVAEHTRKTGGSYIPAVYIYYRVVTAGEENPGMFDYRLETWLDNYELV